MAYPFQTQAQSSQGALNAKPTTSHNPEWRCTRCDKLLGVCRDGRMHLRFARGHEYFVGFPVQATCRGCGTLNQASSPTG
jgi:phage FluMu protein Com